MVDIIVRAKDGREMTERCVKSLAQTEAAYRLILVQSGSDVMPPDECPYDTAYLYRHTPIGAVTATNLGLAISLSQAASEYVMIMDNDAWVPEGDKLWLSRMISELEQYGEKTAAVGATSDNVSVRQQILIVPQTYTADWKSDKQQGFKDNPPVPAFVSFCVLIRKSVLRQLGPWDERYEPGNWEDTDYSLTIREAGYDIRVARSVYVHHGCHMTFGKNMDTLLRENHGKFIEKWGLGRLWDLGLAPPRDVAIAAGHQAGILKKT